MTNVSMHSDMLRRPLELPCGAILKNRLAKSAMSDSLANGEDEPTAAQMRLTALGEDREDTFSLDLSSAIRAYEERDALRCHRWIKKFNAN